ncbi:hypothetical protein Zmor_027789 [Zophobas morio]|uniref:Uncharacterized protein n=1 Tax=Zophobas morio TaxID=2755281 RepID=A0AA38HRM3_9CUCU|nr:hypothetical protein Zmor_027789 [Zophobas morio]
MISCSLDWAMDLIAYKFIKTGEIFYLDRTPVTYSSNEIWLYVTNTELSMWVRSGFLDTENFEECCAGYTWLDMQPTIHHALESNRLINCNKEIFILLLSLGLCVFIS